MLANLSGFDEAERIAPEKMPELERFMLAKLAELDDVVRAATRSTTSTASSTRCSIFCTNELSAFYFDIRKDALYCDAQDAACAAAPPAR